MTVGFAAIATIALWIVGDTLISQSGISKERDIWVMEVTSGVMRRTLRLTLIKYDVGWLKDCGLDGEE